MELYIGGTSQGKLAYVLKKFPGALIVEGKNAEDEGQGKETDRTGSVVIWNRFHLSVRQWLMEGWEPGQIWERMERWLEATPRAVIISDEIGNGIVPMEKEERRYREETGRLLCKLAERATLVERICCGLPLRIK